ncbi:MAG: erythromycin esterase family protein [Hyphomonas sp.]
MSASMVAASACATRVDEATPLPAGPSFLSLLAAQAVPVRRIAADDPGVRALAAGLAKAQISGLGEATHGSHEDALLKSVLVQVMVERHGLRTILVEANRAGVAELNAYASGAPTGLLAAEAVKQAAVFRILKTEVMADLLTWLRGWNAVNGDQPVRLVGIDCQNSSVDAAEALAALARIDSGAADALANSLAPVVSEAARTRRHDLMIRGLTSAELGAAHTACLILEEELSRHGLKEAVYAARLAGQGLIAFELETSDNSLTGADTAYWSRRDTFMAANALDRIGTARGVFWGHNMHVLAGRPGGSAAGFTPAGAVLRDKLGDDYVALTQEFAAAEFLALPERPANGNGSEEAFATIRRKARPGTLNALLASASARTAWFDLSTLGENALTEAWRAEEIGIDWYGARAAAEPSDTDIRHMPPGNLFGFMVIHPQLTPSRML